MCCRARSDGGPGVNGAGEQKAPVFRTGHQLCGCPRRRCPAAQTQSQALRSAWGHTALWVVVSWETWIWILPLSTAAQGGRDRLGGACVHLDPAQAMAAPSVPHSQFPRLPAASCALLIHLPARVWALPDTADLFAFQSVEQCPHSRKANGRARTRGKLVLSAALRPLTALRGKVIGKGHLVLGVSRIHASTCFGVIL